MSKVNPEVFLKAAEMVATEWFLEYDKEHFCCCDAIRYLTGHWSSNESIFFANLFKPEHFFLGDFWFGTTEKNESNRNRRVLALLLAYEIAKG